MLLLLKYSYVPGEVFFVIDEYEIFFFYLDFYITSTQIPFFSSSFNSPNKQFNCILNRASPAVEENASVISKKGDLKIIYCSACNSKQTPNFAKCADIFLYVFVCDAV